MNLFLPSPIIEISVESLDDKRVVKMVLETAQVLSTAIRIYDPETQMPVYKMTHKNHPVSIWVRATPDNYKFALDYFIKICKEYTHRFGKTHKSESLLPYFIEFFKHISTLRIHTKNIFMIDLGQTPFANCTDFKQDEVHIAYKKALVTKWKNDKLIPKWTNRTRPTWDVVV